MCSCPLFTRSLIAFLATVRDAVPGRETEFEKTIEKAKLIISSIPGFRSLQLSKCVEQPNKYLLLVEWDTLEDHVEGFRGSPSYQKWRALLHEFYDPFPTVLHFENRVRVIAEKM
ncbi:MAG: antibiotic biosynthesis monooxygenase [Actinomycetota bacterium]